MKIYCSNNRLSNLSDREIFNYLVDKDLWIKLEYFNKCTANTEYLYIKVLGELSPDKYKVYFVEENKCHHALPYNVAKLLMRRPIPIIFDGDSFSNKDYSIVKPIDMLTTDELSEFICKEG